MAALDFKCNDCGEKFFEIVNSSNKDKVVCPKCHSKNVKQVFEGKCQSGGASKGSGCSGGCGTCGGCH
ncbi:MAG: zinc ribbon domain-containing protein [Lutispora sp.]|nr:zinc ribbon domain-containing protein [Lutispora sp.]MDD4834548.1 zinc ribbon domain-containing protein [Lutispora sp.]